MIRNKSLLLVALFVCEIVSCEKQVIPVTEEKGNMTISVMQIE